MSSPDSPPEIECAVCLQQSVHPVKLPCSHIFCFLCIKGAAFVKNKCPFCRADVPHSYFNSPELVEVEDNNDCDGADDLSDGYQWFYKGVNGWWQYEVRTARELEESYKAGEPSCSVYVSGLSYLVDFAEMFQRRKDHTGRVRKVKRDLAGAAKKGIAGIKMDAIATKKTTTSSHTSSVSNAATGDDKRESPAAVLVESLEGAGKETVVVQDEPVSELRRRRRRRNDSPVRDLSDELADLSLGRSSRV